MKVDVKNTMQIHSRAKVDFYKTYLERYVAILCQSPYIRHIRIYDVFCGMGIYEDGGKGSPVVAYDTIKAIYEAHKITNDTARIYAFFKPFIMHQTPMMMKGIERICPMSMGSEFSKASCTSLVYSMKKRKVKM